MNTDKRDRELYLDWVNNFLTVERFAEYYGMHPRAALALIQRERAKDWHLFKGRAKG